MFNYQAAGHHGSIVSLNRSEGLAGAGPKEHQRRGQHDG